jgi:(S)-2-hydroxyglutarate dehydrogenase
MIHLKIATFLSDHISVNPSQVVQAMRDDAIQEGLELHSGVHYLKRTGKGAVKTSQGNIEFGYMVNAAGLYADKIAQDFGFSRDYRILPFKGLFLHSNEPVGAFQTNISIRFLIYGILFLECILRSLTKER